MAEKVAEKAITISNRKVISKGMGFTERITDNKATNFGLTKVFSQIMEEKFEDTKSLLVSQNKYVSTLIHSLESELKNVSNMEGVDDSKDDVDENECT